MESEIVEHTVPHDEIIDANSAKGMHDERRCIGEDEECSSNCKSDLGNMPVGALLGGEDQEGGGGGGGGGDLAIEVNHQEEEVICRICHLGCFDVHSSMGGGGESDQLIELGCNCRGELGMSHRYCAETWFNQRGNRTCEICGVMAKNVTITKKATRIWIVDFDDMRPIGGNSYHVSSSSSSTRMCRQTFCNLLLACVVLVLVIPWFFRIKLF